MDRYNHGADAEKCATAAYTFDMTRIQRKPFLQLLDQIGVIQCALDEHVVILVAPAARIRHHTVFTVRRPTRTIARECVCTQGGGAREIVTIASTTS